MSGYSGGCQCGAVRYRATSAIGYPHICHCRMCQKASGNYFLPLGSVDISSFEITRGEPQWFFSSEVVRRGFCATCGTPLFYDVPRSGSINVTLGSLDEPESVRPVAQSNLKTKMCWFEEVDGLPIEPDDATNERETKIAASNRQHPDHDTKPWPMEKTP